MAIRRTTVAAPAELLDFWAAEAERRGMSLSAVLADALAEQRTQLRARRKPRLGVVESDGTWSAAEYASEPIAEPYR